MGEIHELFVLALSLVWFAGATPDCREVQKYDQICKIGSLKKDRWSLRVGSLARLRYQQRPIPIGVFDPRGKAHIF